MTTMLKGPGDFLPPEDDRAAAEDRAAEAIAEDATRVRALVADGVGDDSPCTDDVWCTEVLLSLRELRPVFAALGRGVPFDRAMKIRGAPESWRALLSCATTADEWIAEQIDRAAQADVAWQCEEACIRNGWED